MGAMFRSEEMALCQLFIQPEAAYASVSELGESGTAQFRDLNSEVNSFHRKFVSQVRRCDELERKLRYIEAELNKDGVFIPEIDEMPRAPNPREMIDLEANLEKTENEILELSLNAVNLKSNFLELTELRHVLEKSAGFFAAQEGTNGIDSLTRALITEDPMQTTVAARGRLGFVAGVAPRERVPAFERMLWRISRGNVFLRQVELEEPLEDPTTGNEIFKVVFVAFFQGEQLKSRVKKVCAGFHASLYPCPNTFDDRKDMLLGVCTRLDDLTMVLNQTRDHRHRVLMGVAKQLQPWTVMVRKMKAIYHTLNLFNMDVTKKCLIAECWVPVGDLQGVQRALADGGRAVGSSIPSFLNVIASQEDPPTFNRTNKFTRGFQNLIDSYGVASYREVNPALYTIITFPFLFATMFGDAGHGLVMLCFALYMVLWEKKLMQKKYDSETWDIFFNGRYIILLMGIFSIYTGIIYNDLFSRSVNLFGSSWITNYNTTTVQGNAELTLDPAGPDYAQVPYPMGLDPVWQLAPGNKIIFLNSYKMKLSIIFGVVHMIFGVCFSIVNHLHFKKPLNIVFEFIPQLLFLILLFGYMVILMLIKWVNYKAENSLDGSVIKTSANCAPSVLIMFINMVLFKSATVPQGCDEFMFEGQDALQKALVALALLCIPVMLFGKPIALILSKRRNLPPPATTTTTVAGNGNVVLDIEMRATGTPGALQQTPAEAEWEEPMSEVFITQAIHTIEYVLSTVSHTASYLRLWALSLAHAQLSEVLWTMVMRMALQQSSFVGSIILYFIFACWAFLTLFILVMMEGLSAFLHTLRLHWVEFMSKFYEGKGYPFQPFSFKSILESAEDEEED